jgi:hypothetical protein
LQKLLVCVNFSAFADKELDGPYISPLCGENEAGEPIDNICCMTLLEAKEPKVDGRSESQEACILCMLPLVTASFHSSFRCIGVLAFFIAAEPRSTDTPNKMITARTAATNAKNSAVFLFITIAVSGLEGTMGSSWQITFPFDPRPLPLDRPNNLPA